MGQLLQNVFVRVYTLMKLNLYFLLVSLMGGLIFGIGPALLTVMGALNEFGWDYKEMGFSQILTRFKENFKRGNQLFYTYLVSLGVLVYNLSLATQVQGLAFIVIDFILIFAVIFSTVSFVFAQVIFVRYEVVYWQGLKLGMVLFFINFLTILKLLIGFSALAFLTYKSPGLLLFGTFASYQVFILWATKGIFTKFEVDYFMDEVAV